MGAFRGLMFAVLLQLGLIFAGIAIYYIIKTIQLII